jgi:hypothetical protein
MSDGATAWIAPNWPGPAACRESSQDRRSLYAGCDLFEQFEPFRADASFEAHKPGGVAARPRQTAAGNTIGTVRVSRNNGPTVEVPGARMTSDASATNSAPYLRVSSASNLVHRVSFRILRPVIQLSKVSSQRNKQGEELPLEGSRRRLVQLRGWTCYSR